jgi:hypothetical protein
MNCSAEKSAVFPVPAEFAGATELTRPAALAALPRERQVPPRSTVVLRRISTR